MADFLQNKISDIKQYLRIKRIYVTIRYYIIKLLDRFDMDHIWIMSSGIAFNFLLCIVPFLLILFTILGVYLDSSNTIEKLNENLNNLIPLPVEMRNQITNELLDRIRELSSNTWITGLIGVVGMLWTVSGLFSAFRDVLSRVYNLKIEKNYFILKLRDIILALTTILLFLLSLVATYTVTLIEIVSKGVFGFEVSLSFLQSIVSVLVAYAISYILFYIVYRFVPYQTIPKKVVLFSSYISAILFEILKHLFSLYILKFANFGRVYGTYAALVIFIFWIYYVAVIFVIGGEMGAIYLNRNRLKIL
ncbi:MAG: YihY/virulence factor BrkB family protein [Ignavibacteria bacterium]|nr:YihY/virulence factor BrkB family protein [Ignavibacteria bacterium]